MASTTGSRAVIRKAAQAGETIPKGWALDKNGEPTIDPIQALAGTMQPIGDAKGSALALMIELLCSTLAGGIPGYEVRPPQDMSKTPSGVSHCFVALKLDAFGRVDDLLQTHREGNNFTGTHRGAGLEPADSSSWCQKNGAAQPK